MFCLQLLKVKRFIVIPDLPSSNVSTKPKLSKNVKNCVVIFTLLETKNDGNLLNKLKTNNPPAVVKYSNIVVTAAHTCFLTSVPLSLVLNELLTNPLVAVKYSNIVEIVAAVDLVDFNPCFLKTKMTQKREKI